MKREVEDGVPIARIARRYGVSRQSIYNVLKAAPSEEKARRPSKLDPFKDHVSSRLADFDLPATVLLREIRELGYAGGITILKEFVSSCKSEQVRQVIERFETLPGRQAQLDWGECGTILEHGERRKLYAFVLVLGYSRMLFARFTTSMRQPALLSCLRETFERLGVPKELLVDNMKTAVDRHALGEEVRFNSGFLDFCEHYGCLPVACPPYWPRAKGKVESSVKYLKRSFLTGVGQESFTYEVGHEEARSATTATVLVSQPWSTLGAMPEPVSRAAAVWLDGRMYVLGGEGNAGDRAGLVQMYDPELDSWDSSGPAMPAPVSNVCAAAVGDDIYVIGGSGALSTTDAVQRFSTTDRVWTSLTLDALPTARWTTACATLDDVIYVFGGTTADQANGSDELLAFDPSLPVGERWITGLSRAPVVSQFAAVVPYGDRLLVTGLYNSASGDLTDVLAYLPGNDEWVPYTDLPEARGAGAAWVHDDVLYVGGGGYNSYLDSVVTYDLTEGAAGAWAATESLISGRRTVAFASDPATGWLYIAGGWNGNYMDSAEVGRLVTGAY